MARADREKERPPGFQLRECNGVPTKLRGFKPTSIKGSPLQSQLLRQKFLAERNLVSHDVIANSSQFIAQRFGGQARIGLSDFTDILASEMLVVSTRQMRSLGEGPAQIAIAVFTVAMALAFAVR